VVPIDFKAAITEDLAEIDLALSILNCLRNVNLARLALLQEAEKRMPKNRSEIDCQSKANSNRSTIFYIYIVSARYFHSFEVMTANLFYLFCGFQSLFSWI